MEVIFREHILGHLLKPCIETFFNGRNEFAGALYGFKNKDRFILEDVFIDFTADGGKRTIHFISNKIQKKIDQNLDGLVTCYNLGHVHPHIIKESDLDEVENKKEFIEYLKYYGEPSKMDRETMEKDCQHIYLIMAFCDKRYNFRWSYMPDEKGIIGNTKDMTFHISAWYYNRKKKKHDSTKIIAQKITQQKAL